MPNVHGHEKLFGFNFYDLNLGDGTIAAVGFDGSNLIDNIQSLNGFAKHRISTIQLCAGLLVLHDVEL